MIPLRNIQNCDGCERPRGVYDFGCRGCVARYVASLPRQFALDWVDAAKLKHSPDVVIEFLKEANEMRRASREKRRVTA